MIKWTTEEPTEAGWYFAYGYIGTGWTDNHFTPKVEIQRVVNIMVKEAPPCWCVTDFYDDDQNCIEISKTKYTHWSKIELPEPPK